jgi:cytochrome c oxidase cbb3-type subunit 3
VNPRFLFLAALLSLASCNRDVREWTPADHDRTDDPTNGARPEAPGKPPTPAEQEAQLVEVTWSQQCATCHGQNGKGDGPSGPMLRAPDLTRADFQSAITDEMIVKAITQGKGKMPKLDLPAGVVNGLVKRVRRVRAK